MNKVTAYLTFFLLEFALNIAFFRITSIISEWINLVVDKKSGMWQLSSGEQLDGSWLVKQNVKSNISFELILIESRCFLFFRPFKIENNCFVFKDGIFYICCKDGGTHIVMVTVVKKWTNWHGFKSWTRMIAFHIALTPVGKIYIELFTIQLLSKWLGKLGSLVLVRQPV